MYMLPVKLRHGTTRKLGDIYIYTFEAEFDKITA